MIDWKVVANLFASSGAAAVAAGVGSVKMQPEAPWQVHAGVAAAAGASYFLGHLRRSPLKG